MDILESLRMSLPSRIRWTHGIGLHQWLLRNDHLSIYAIKGTTDSRGEGEINRRGRVSTITVHNFPKKDVAVAATETSGTKH